MEGPLWLWNQSAHAAAHRGQLVQRGFQPRLQEDDVAQLGPAPVSRTRLQEVRKHVAVGKSAARGGEDAMEARQVHLLARHNQKACKCNP